MILAIDTAFGPIGVALVSASGEVVAYHTIMDALGAQAEKLPPLVQRMFAEAEVGPTALQRIAVTTGPGAFTGVRVGLAFAKGMALALKVPLLGFTTLTCLAAQARAREATAASYASVIDARRGELYVQAFDAALASLIEPEVMTLDHARQRLLALARPMVLAGSGAGLIELPDAQVLGVATIDARLVALMAMHADPAAHAPVPCYLRAPDARLPS